MVVTDAPTTPVVAAKMVDTTITAIPRPPFILPNSSFTESKRPSATPEAVKKFAIKTNIGIAIKE